MAGLQAPLSTLRLAPRDALRSSIDQRSKEKRLMTSRMRRQQSDGFLTIRNAWMVGKTLTPSNQSRYSKRILTISWELRYYSRRPLFYSARNELCRRDDLQKTRGLTCRSP